MTEENKDIQDKNSDAASIRNGKEAPAESSETNSDQENSEGATASSKSESGKSEPGKGEAANDDERVERIARLEAENAELRDKVLRTIAEMENIRRRTEREKADISKYAITKFAGDILSVSDNIRRAIEATPKDSSGSDPALRSLVEGVEMTERDLTNVLERHGIKRIDPLKEKFDPNFHQAMFEEESKDVPTGNVVRVMQSGFMIEDRLLRPALVSVAKAWTGPVAEKPAAEDAPVKAERVKTERVVETPKDPDSPGGSSSVREAKTQPQNFSGSTRPEWTAPRQARPNPSRPTVTELRRPSSSEGQARARVSVDPSPFSATQRPAQQPSSGAASSSRTSTLHQPVISPTRPGPRRNGGD